MNSPLFLGSRIRLVVADPAADVDVMLRWARDSEYLRLLDSDYAALQSKKEREENIEKYGVGNEHHFPFVIRALADDRLLGFIGLWVAPAWPHRNGWVGLGIGQREDWGHGYGTEAMRLILRYGFHELDLDRISLGLFEYNPRARHSYEKAGFVLEGRTRQDVCRDGQRHDSLWMGILRAEWEARNEH